MKKQLSPSEGTPISFDRGELLRENVTYNLHDESYHHVVQVIRVGETVYCSNANLYNKSMKAFQYYLIWSFDSSLKRRLDY